MAKKAITYMRGSASFVLEGADEMIATIKKLGDIAAGAAVMEAVIAGGKVLEDEIESRAPGPHIVTWPSLAGIKRGFAEVWVGPDKEHWHYRFLETGATAHEIDEVTAGALLLVGGEVRLGPISHPGMAAKPFMRPGFDVSAEKVKREVGEVLMAKLRMAV